MPNCNQITERDSKRATDRVKGTTLALALALTASLVVSGCTNPTSTAGRVSYFTEGVITDIEHISLDLDHYDTKSNAALGAAIGAGAGQIIGDNTESTLIGAGIGAIVAGASSAFMNRTDDGARLTVNTNQGLILVDQPFSCNFKKGARVRMINQDNNNVQVQVLVNGSWRTAEKGSPKDCPL